MSYQIPIEPVPNQNLSFTLDFSWVIDLKITNSSFIATITRDDEVLVQNIRVMNDSFIIPYRYLSKQNFYLQTQNEELPDYNKFGISQFLIYFQEDELND